MFDAVRDWACAKFGLDPAKIVRPFYPGGDYQNFDYPDGCVVLDNPPFSILAEIKTFYLEIGIKFFLFAPTLTLLSGRRSAELTHIVNGADITYENGAVVKTSFVTNMMPGVVICTAPDLCAAIEAAVASLKSAKPEMPKYSYPANVLTTAMLEYHARRGVEYILRASDCAFIRALDAQRGTGKGIFGGGLLLSDKAAADKAAADKAAADKAAADKAAADKAAAREVTVWQLSPREREIIKILNAQSEKGAGK